MRKNALNAQMTEAERLLYSRTDKDVWLIAGLLCTSLIIGVTYFLGVQKPKEKLEKTVTPKTPVVAVIDLDAICRTRDGVVMTKQSAQGEMVKWCFMTDGTSCVMDTDFGQGGCSNGEYGAVLGSQTIVSSAPTVQPSPSPLPPDSTFVYQLQITRKPDTIDPIEPRLIDYVQTAMDTHIPDLDYRITGVYYDTSSGNPYTKENRYYFNYLIEGIGSLEGLPLMIEDYASIMRIEPVDQILLDYLTDNDYCQSNQDCVIRKSTCTYGAFNRFEKFVDAYACGQIIDEFGAPTVFFDTTQNCKAERVFAIPVCDNNQCMPTQEAARCLER